MRPFQHFFLSATVLLLHCAPTQKHTAAIPFAQDESTMERAMVPRFRAVGLKVSETSKDGDLWLEFHFDGKTRGGVPFSYRVDTLPSTKDGSARAIQVALYTHQYVPVSHRSQALALINEFNRKVWMGRFYLDDDGEVRSVEALNVLADAPNVSADSVIDVVARCNVSWETFYKVLAAASILSSQPSVADHLLPRGDSL